MVDLMARPRQSGLGPLGHDAIQRAADIDQGHAPIIGRPNTGPVNPSVISSRAPNEDEDIPYDWWSFDSSRVKEAAYDPENQRLYVRFMKPRPEGTPWTYDGVAANEWRNFRRSQSPGRYVNRVLNTKDYHRGNF